jgi:hypothetical protein
VSAELACDGGRVTHRLRLRRATDSIQHFKEPRDNRPCSRDGLRPSDAWCDALVKQSRAQGRPGARCTHGPRAKRCLRVRALTTGTGGITPAFPAQWFTAYFALSPVNQLVATVIFEKAQASSKTWRLHGRARTTRLRCPRKRAARQSAFPRPPHPAPRS